MKQEIQEVLNLMAKCTGSFQQYNILKIGGWNFMKNKQKFLTVFSDDFGHCDTTNIVILRLLCLWDTESSK